MHTSDSTDRPRTPVAAPRMTPADGLAALRDSGDPELATLFRHGTLDVEFYKPDCVDRQSSHTRDEVYVIASGTGLFVNDGRIQTVGPGEVLFVPAGVQHRFERFTDDFATWVFFYGPEGGEVAGTDSGGRAGG